MGLFEKMTRYDDDVAKEFSMSLIPLTRANATTIVKGLLVATTPKVISRVLAPKSALG